MISVYKNANKERKQYKVKYVKSGTTKNGSAYTSFKINDNKQDQTTKAWISRGYTVFVWEKLNIKDDDQIEFLEIQSIECEEYESNGEKKFKGTIFADVRVINAQPAIDPSLSPLNNADDPFANIGQQQTMADGDDLPF